MIFIIPALLQFKKSRKLTPAPGLFIPILPYVPDDNAPAFAAVPAPVFVTAPAFDASDASATLADSWVPAVPQLRKGVRLTGSSCGTANVVFLQRFESAFTTYF